MPISVLNSAMIAAFGSVLFVTKFETAVWSAEIEPEVYVINPPKTCVWGYVLSVNSVTMPFGDINTHRSRW